MKGSDLVHVNLYTDGGADPNPGRGAWGIILKAKGKFKEFSQAYKRTTNNRMEILAVVSGLEKLNQKCKVTVHSDSQYVVNSIEKGWVKTWKAKNWVKQGEPVPNADLWVRLLDLLEIHQVKFQWIRGHNGHPENERCDELATMAIQSPDAIEDTGYKENRPKIPANRMDSASQDSPEGKVLKEGDPCRNCKTPVVKREPTRRKFHASQTYYFEYYFFCPSCRTQYNTEEAKREIVHNAGLFGS
jgi:ribonuclease HI